MVDVTDDTDVLIRDILIAFITLIASEGSEFIRDDSGTVVWDLRDFLAKAIAVENPAGVTVLTDLIPVYLVADITLSVDIGAHEAVFSV